MLDAAVALVALLLALMTRLPRFRGLGSLLLPLLLTAVAASARLALVALELLEPLEIWIDSAYVLSVAFLASRTVLLALFEWVLARRMNIQVPLLVRDVVALVVYATAAALLLPHVGIQVTGLVATSAVLTIVLGLALQQTLGNLLAGLALAWEQRVASGSWIEVNGRPARVVETGWRSIIVRTRVGERILIPNAEIASERLVLLGGDDQPVAVRVMVGVSYRVPPDEVKRVLFEVAADLLEVLDDPPPQILTNEFADSAVLYECRLWTRAPWRREMLADAFLTSAHAALARAGMEIPFPQRTLHLAEAPDPGLSERRKLDALRASVLFADLEEGALAALAELSEWLRFAPGERVVSEGQAGRALYLVAEGVAEVSTGRKRITTLGPGEVFGEAAFLTGEPRSASVQAGRQTHLCVVEVDADALRGLLEEHPELADGLAQRMAERQAAGEEVRDATGAVVAPRRLASQIRVRLLRLVGIDPDE